MMLRDASLWDDSAGAPLKPLRVDSALRCSVPKNIEVFLYTNIAVEVSKSAALQFHRNMLIF